MLPLCLFAAFAATLAQEGVAPEAKPPKQDRRMGTLFAEVSGWWVQPQGLEYTPVSEDYLVTFDSIAFPKGLKSLGAVGVTLDHDYQVEFRLKAGYALRDNHGEFSVTFWKLDDESYRAAFRPGAFVFGETLAAPYRAGAFEDGWADGFDAVARTKTQDVRVDYGRVAFSSPRAVGKWFVGYRNVLHDRSIVTSYYALAPNLPPLLPPLTTPRPDLDPLPDRARVESELQAQGLEGGMDFVFPIKGRFSVETGLSIAVLRGTLKTEYSSSNHYYALLDGEGQIIRILEPPFDEFEQRQDPTNPNSAPLVDRIRQFSLVTGYTVPRESTSPLIVEAYLGFRAKLWKDYLEMFAGVRNIRMSRVGADAQPLAVGQNSLRRQIVQGVSRVEHDADFEGYYLGLAVRF